MEINSSIFKKYLFKQIIHLEERWKQNIEYTVFEKPRTVGTIGICKLLKEKEEHRPRLYRFKMFLSRVSFYLTWVESYVNMQSLGKSCYYRRLIIYLWERGFSDVNTDLWYQSESIREHEPYSKSLLSWYIFCICCWYSLRLMPHFPYRAMSGFPIRDFSSEMMLLTELLFWPCQIRKFYFPLILASQ